MHNNKKKDRLKRLVSLVFAAILLFSQLLYVKSAVLADDTNDNNAGVTYESSDNYFSVKTNIKPADGEKNTYDVTLTLTNKNQFNGTVTVFPKLSSWFELVPDSVKTNAEDAYNNISYENNLFILDYGVHYHIESIYFNDQPDKNTEEKFVTFKVRAKEDLLEDVELGKTYPVFDDVSYVNYSGNAPYNINVGTSFKDFRYSTKIDKTKNVTVKYYKDYVSDNEEGNPNYLGEDTGTLMNYEIGTTIPKAEIPVNNTNFVPSGYVGEGEITNLNSDDGYTVTKGDNVINVVYKTKKIYTWSVTYYKDGISKENVVHSESGSGVMGTVIPFSPDNKQEYIDKYRPQGYNGKVSVICDVDKFKGYVQPFEDDPTTENVDEGMLYNAVQIVYTREPYPYTIEYYKDSVDGTNLICTVSNDNNGALRGYEGDVVSYNDVSKTYRKPDKGYKDGVIVGEDSNNTGLTITSDTSKNVIRVLYLKDSFPYTVNYYVEGEDEPFKTDTDNGEFDSLIPYVDKTGDLPAEYEEKLKGYEETGEVTKYNEKGVITTDPDKNVIDVVFKLKDVPYVVEYYKEVLDPVTKEIKTEKITSYDGEVKYGTEFAYHNDDTQKDDAINVNVDKENPGEGYLEKAEILKAPEKTGLVKEDNVVQILYKLVPQEEIAADIDEVKPKEKPTIVNEDVGEIAADTDIVVLKEDAGEVAADVSTAKEVKTGDANTIILITLLALMISCAITFVQVSLKNKNL